VGPAAQHAPADLHKASEALARAEEAFEEDSDSYETRDLAYVAQRKAEMAGVLASIAIEKQSKAAADSAYQLTQDKLLEEKKRELAASEEKAAAAMAALAELAAIREEERGLIITLSGSVLFRSGEATLMPEAQAKLDQVAAALIAGPEHNVVVEGFTDSQGTDQYNLDLSQRRATAVRDYLVHRGFPASRIQAHGIGEGRPVADNNTAEGRANNRRVEIVLERK
jgi:outer membrane protein OmpA-like peptidoglycan-associated protein